MSPRFLHLAVICAFASGGAFAQEIPDAVKHARQSVYRVEFSEGQDNVSVGSAWAISSDTLITNAHVVSYIEKLATQKGQKVSMFLVDFDGNKLPVIEYAAFEHIDAATLKISSNSLSPLPIVDIELPVDTSLWNLSYPEIADAIAPSKDAQLSSGSVQSYFDYTPQSGTFGLTRVLKHNAASGAGSSGSPVLDACGNVMGLHFGGTHDDAGAGLPGATRMAISGKVLADYVRLESPQTKFTIAPPCSPTTKNTVAFSVAFGTVAILLFAGLLGYFWKRRSSHNVRPTDPTSETEQTILLQSLDSSNPFAVEGRFAPNMNSLFIGSSADPARQNSVILTFPSISRQHARLERIGSSLLITDLNSTNGTIVNGEKLIPNTPKPIVSGSTVRCGAVEVKVTLK